LFFGNISGNNYIFFRYFGRISKNEIIPKREEIKEMSSNVSILKDKIKGWKIKRVGKAVFLVFALQSFRQTVAVIFFSIEK